MVALGNANVISLAEARTLAAAALHDIANGIDPADANREKRRKQKEEAVAKEMTFKAVAKRWVENRVKAGYYDRNVREPAVTEGYLARNILPVIGQLHISQITSKQVYKCVKPLWTTTSSARRKALQIISGIWKWAVAMEYVSGDNPASLEGPLGVLLKNHSLNPKGEVHYGAVPWEEIPELFVELNILGTVGARALMFSILTAARSQMIRQMRWGQVDLKKKQWTVPEELMKIKGRGNFVVYLSDAAVNMLNNTPRFADTDLVFPSPMTHGPISIATLGMAMRKLSDKRMAAIGRRWEDPNIIDKTGAPAIATQHGTARASFKTWTRNEENLHKYNHDAVEMCLAHSIKDAYRGAYDRATLEAERRRIMQDWGEYCWSKISPPKRG